MVSKDFGKGANEQTKPITNSIGDETKCEQNRSSTDNNYKPEPVVTSNQASVKKLANMFSKNKY